MRSGTARRTQRRDPADDAVPECSLNETSVTSEQPSAGCYPIQLESTRLNSSPQFVPGETGRLRVSATLLESQSRPGHREPLRPSPAEPPARPPREPPCGPA